MPWDIERRASFTYLIGYIEGWRIGYKEGRLQMALEMVRLGHLTMEKAASYLDMNPQALADIARKGEEDATSETE